MRTNEQKAKFSDRKKLIQARFWSRIGLIVDKPKSAGSGNTNDGNTARRAFSDINLFAEILNIDSKLIGNLKTILIALSSHLPIDSTQFDKLCFATAKLYVDQYNWFPMPATLHKILIHGADIINTSILPTGMLGEKGPESRNRNYKNYREFHSRKLSRTTNLQDVFYRAMDTSDPIISTITLNTRFSHRKLPLPKEVKDLLAIPIVDSANYLNPEDETDLEDIQLTGVPETLAYLDQNSLSNDESESINEN